MIPALEYLAPLPEDAAELVSATLGFEAEANCCFPDSPTSTTGSRLLGFGLFFSLA